MLQIQFETTKNAFILILYLQCYGLKSKAFKFKLVYHSQFWVWLLCQWFVNGRETMSHFRLFHKFCFNTSSLKNQNISFKLQELFEETGLILLFIHNLLKPHLLLVTTPMCWNRALRINLLEAQFLVLPMAAVMNFTTTTVLRLSPSIHQNYVWVTIAARFGKSEHQLNL